MFVHVLQIIIFFLFSELPSNRRFVFWYLSIFIVPKCLQGNSIHARDPRQLTTSVKVGRFSMGETFDCTTALVG